MSYGGMYQDPAIGGVIPAVRRKPNPGGYPSRNPRYRNTGYRVGYKNIPHQTGMSGGFGAVRRYDRLPNFRQHPVSGAVAASMMRDHRDVANHVKQAYWMGRKGKFVRGMSGSRGGFRRGGYSRGRSFGFRRPFRSGGGYRRFRRY